MPQIVRAEFLKYYNPSRNSDKVFNVFLIEDADGTFSCISEYGRRGNRLVRDTLCTNTSREVAEGKLRQKLLAKRNHRETPYSDDPFGQSVSGVADEYEFKQTEKTDEYVNCCGRKDYLHQWGISFEILTTGYCSLGGFGKRQF